MQKMRYFNISGGKIDEMSLNERLGMILDSKMNEALIAFGVLKPFQVVRPLLYTHME